MNLLRNEKSLYLQQHAQNPVEWHAWNDAALAKAKAENKPILLSIGYAACHWCHVMAHESFEDEETAAVMNKYFVNIKVDREERPDIDKIYQTAHYLLTQSNGGWPLTIFLMPNDLTPFFSGTYFPVAPRYHLPAFKTVLQSIADVYAQKQTELNLQNKELLSILKRESVTDETQTLTTHPITQALEILKNSYDETHGGFGGAPKFPQAPKLEFLYAMNSPLLNKTLISMAESGLYDHLAGGFFRYTVDAAWEIPHFEKMLYDNAQLLALYGLSAEKPYLKHIAQQTADWTISTMQAPQSGYYASIDADSAEGEGQFYVWTEKALKQLLNDEELSHLANYFNTGKAANFEEAWHLRLRQPLSLTDETLKNALNKLRIARVQRNHPSLDQKIITSWNALMIKAMFIAGQQLKQQTYIQSAQAALAFIQKDLWDGVSLKANANPNSPLGFLDDYAFLLDAVITALAHEWKNDLLKFAIALAECLLTHFADTTNGGFYFTAHQQPTIVYRPKIMMDEAIPSGNGIAVQALLTLSHLIGEMRYYSAAEKCLKAAWPYLVKYPTEHCSLLLGLKSLLEPKPFIVLRGTQDAMASWQALGKDKQVFAIPDTENNLPGILANMPSKGEVCAYVCSGTQCSNVIETISEFEKAILIK